MLIPLPLLSRPLIASSSPLLSFYPSLNYNQNSQIQNSFYLSLNYNQNSKILLDFLLGSDDTSLTCTHAHTLNHNSHAQTQKKKKKKKASREVSPLSMRDKREINFIPFLCEVSHLSLNRQTRYIHFISWMVGLSSSSHPLSFTLLHRIELNIHIPHYIFSLILLLRLICPSRSKNKTIYSLSVYTAKLLLFSILYLLFLFFSFSGLIRSLLLL